MLKCNASPQGAKSFADFDLTRLDHLSGKMDTLKSLVWVAVDLVSTNEKHGENLLHAALHLYDSIAAEMDMIHTDLSAIKREAGNA